MHEQELPIDIQTGKLLDWLVSRRHVKKNWPESVQIIRQKINNAIQDMPEHPEITKLLSGAYINYFHCLQIIEILRETEKDSKNIFGWYTSQRMKDWQDIVHLYVVDNVHLAEAAQFLVRNVNYEVPSLRKQITKCRQVQEDCEKKVESSIKGAAAAKDKFYSSCKRIGITGDNVKDELIGLLNNLPEKLNVVGEQAKSLKEARNYYEEYTQFIVSSQRCCLPLLKFIIEHGDVTVYEWKYGEPPLTVEKPSLELYVNKDDVDGIDFGPVEGDVSDEIDFGELSLETGDIDWGGLNSGEGETQEICFGENVDSVEVESSEIVVESSGVEGGAATGTEAFSLLFNADTRNQFINELLELEGFLSQRKVELGATENLLSMSLFTTAPQSLQYQSVETISSYLTNLSDITRELQTPQMLHLYMISSSPRYVDRLAKSLTRHMRDSERLASSIDGIKTKGEEAATQERVLAKHLKLIVSRTKELQENIEKQISLKYNNRTVNLMGGVQHM